MYGVEIEVVRKPVKNMYLRVRGNSVVITAPARLRLEEIRYFAAEKLEWIKKQLAARQSAAEPEYAYEHGEVHRLWGENVVIERILSPRAGASLVCGAVQISAPLGTTAQEARALFESLCRAQLRSAVPPLLEKWQARLGVTCSSWRLRDMKSRWGSCNVKTGALCLNVQLVKKPPQCLEYVVVHELCHLLVPNHSPQFWAYVADCLPDWKRRRLLTNGLDQKAK